MSIRVLLLLLATSRSFGAAMLSKTMRARPGSIDLSFCS